MTGQRISQIYFYLISAFAIILMVIGTYHTITFLLNSTQYDKYPLLYGNSEERCDFSNPYSNPKGPYPVDVQPPASMSAEQQQTAREQCLRGLETERKQRRVDDLKNSLVFMLSGLVLFAIHFPIALRRSKDKK